MSNTKLDWELFKPLFGEWAQKFEPFFQNSGFDKIYEKLKTDSARGKRIAPLSENVFRCFKETPPNEVRVIIAGFCPYHTFTGWGKKLIPGEENESRIIPVADGLCMSCSVTNRLQPSLLKFYEEMERELNNGEESLRNPDLSYLARDNGVLLLNSSLTVEEGKPGSHQEIWKDFMKFLFEEVLITNGIPVIFLGREAAKLKSYVMPFTWIFELIHPAASAYSSSDWNSERMFKKVNKILHDNNQNSIQWIQTK